MNTLVSFKRLSLCKRFRRTVVPSQVRDFRAAMMGRVDKGITLIPGGFTPDARPEAVREGVRRSHSWMARGSYACSKSSRSVY